MKNKKIIDTLIFIALIIMTTANVVLYYNVVKLNTERNKIINQYNELSRKYAEKEQEE